VTIQTQDKDETSSTQTSSNTEIEVKKIDIPSKDVKIDKRIYFKITKINQRA